MTPADLDDHADPSLLPWLTTGVLIGLISGLLALACIFHRLSLPANPPSTPVLVEPK